MGVKYSVQYRDGFNQQCRVDIGNVDWNGDAKILRGVSEKACILSRDCSDNPYDPVVNTKAAISFYQTEDLPIDILELQTAPDREFTVKFYIENALKFSGFMVADGIIQIFQAAPFEVNINAADGLYLLDGIPYDPISGAGLDRNIINYIREILFYSNNLGNPLPVQWTNTLTNDEFPLEDDLFSGSIRWSPFGDGFSELKDGNYVYKDCYYILEGLLKSLQCRIVQDNGVWKIFRINDAVSGVYSINEIQANLDPLSITTREVDVNRQIIGVQDNEAMLEYSFIEEDANLTVLPALKTVTTTYNQDERENILPNGNMDSVSLDKPVFWELNGDTSGSSFSSVPSIYSDRGNAVEVISGNDNGKYFEMISPLPIDSDVLYETMNIGFKFMPVSGFPVDGDGLIIWDANVFSYLVSFYDNDGDIWYLNEFGFWTKDFVALVPITVEGLKLLDVAQIDFNKFQNVPLIVPAVLPIGQTNAPAIKISFFIPTECVIKFDDVYINVPKANDKYEATLTNNKNTAKEEYTLNISSSHNGFYVSSYMTEYGEAGAQKFFSDAKTQSVTLTNMTSQAIMRNRYKPSIMFEGSIYAKNYTYSEIYNIKTLDGKKFLPLKSNWNTETNTIQLTCVEVRDDELSLEVKQNGVNYALE